MSDYITVKEAAKRIKRQPLAIWRYIKQGRLPAERFGGWGYLIHLSDLDKFILTIRKAGRPRK